MKFFKFICYATLSAGIASAAYADVTISIDGQPITDISSITVEPTSGDITVTTTATYIITREDDDNGGPQVSVDDFSVTPSIVDEGDSILVEWSTSNALSCETLGTLAEWTQSSIAVNGAITLQLDNAGTYSLTIRCTDGSNFASDSATVIVEEDVIVPPPDDVDCTGASTLSGQTVTWQSVTSAVFPDPVSDLELITIPRTGYLSLRFETGNVVEDGLISTVAHTSTSSPRIAVISRCPGDFYNQRADDFGCAKSSVQGEPIFWSTKEGAPAGACRLEANTTYYLNLTFTDGISPTSTGCGASPCRAELRVSR